MKNIAVCDVSGEIRATLCSFFLSLFSKKKKAKTFGEQTKTFQTLWFSLPASNMMAKMGKDSKLNTKSQTKNNIGRFGQKIDKLLIS